MPKLWFLKAVTNRKIRHHMDMRMSNGLIVHLNSFRKKLEWGRRMQSEALALLSSHHLPQLLSALNSSLSLVSSSSLIYRSPSGVGGQAVATKITSFRFTSCKRNCLSLAWFQFPILMNEHMPKRGLTLWYSQQNHCLQGQLPIQPLVRGPAAPLLIQFPIKSLEKAI